MMKRVAMAAWVVLVPACLLQTKTSGGTTGPTGAGTSSGGGGDDRASGAGPGHTITIPDTTGMSRSQAEAALHAAGVTGEIKPDNDPGSIDFATGKVCSQVPGGGNQSTSDLIVLIKFCFQDKPVVDKSTHLEGLSVAEATKRAKAAGFTGKIETGMLYEFDPSCKGDTVCRVDPLRWELNQDHSMTLYTNKKTTITTPD